MIPEPLKSVEIDGIFDFSITKDVLLQTPDTFKEHIFGKRIAEQGFFAPYTSLKEAGKGLVDIAYAPLKLFLVSSIATALIPIALTCIAGSLILLIASYLMQEKEHTEQYKKWLCVSLNIGVCTAVISLCSTIINLFLPTIAILNFLTSLGNTIFNALGNHYDTAERQDVLNTATV
ncbi:MAG: hypothetical protein LCH30_03955 [Proteobacteria bacterium]|nr:hypothetical protein [Pseudomonadota bacterium]